MLQHRAFGRPLDTLTVAVIDNRRPILSLMRGMLAAIGTGRIESFESPTEALDAMADNTPDLVIAAAAMQPVTGAALVKCMGRADAGPLALVPAMIMSARAKPAAGTSGRSASGARTADHRQHALPASRLADQRRPPLRAAGRSTFCLGWNSGCRSASSARSTFRPRCRPCRAPRDLKPRRLSAAAPRRRAPAPH